MQKSSQDELKQQLAKVFEEKHKSELASKVNYATSTRRPYVVNNHFRKYLSELRVGVCLKCMYMYMYMYNCTRELWERHISDIVCLA